MQGRQSKLEELERELERDVRALVVYTPEDVKNKSALFVKLAVINTDLFYLTFDFLYLSRADTYYELVSDLLESNKMLPSHYLMYSQLAIKEEKNFYQSDISKAYKDAIIRNRNMVRVAQPEPIKDEEGSHPLMEQLNVKRARISKEPEAIMTADVVMQDAAEDDAFEFQNQNFEGAFGFRR